MHGHRISTLIIWGLYYSIFNSNVQCEIFILRLNTSHEGNEAFANALTTDRFQITNEFTWSDFMNYASHF